MSNFKLMPEIDGLFTTVEEYESMTIEQLQVLSSLSFSLKNHRLTLFFKISILRSGK